MKRKIICILTALVCLACIFVAVSCNNQNDQRQNSRDKAFTETKAESTVSKLDVTGYVAEMLYGNIDNWTISALEKNPGIVDQIKEGPDATYIDTIIKDDSNLINQCLKVGVDKNHGASGDKALMITVFKAYISGGVTYRLPKMQDFTGAGYIQFYVDASEYEGNPFFGISFKKYDTEIWSLEPDTQIQLKSVWSDSWETATANKTAQKSTAHTGRVEIQKGFKGWVKIPIPGDSLSQVTAMTLYVEGVKNAKYGESFYMSDFNYITDKENNFLDLSGFAVGDTNNADGWSMVVWFSEYTGKLLTGMASQYMAKPSEELKNAADNLVAALADAQKEDGYLGIYTEAQRMGKGGNWDPWGHYHIIYGMICWYRLTGNQQALDVAIKAAECVYNEFTGAGKTYDSVGNQTMNLAVCHAFAELYKETNDSKYLDAAKTIVNEEFALSGNWYKEALEGKEFYQSSLPRWEALHPILALGSLYEITGEKDYFTALENIWWSIAKTDRHNTGGFSTTEQAQGDPYAEGAIETCCTVAWQALSVEYLKFSRNSIVADELELSYFNGIFGSLLDDNRLVTYNTPEDGKTRTTAKSNLFNDIKFLFHSGARDFTCCQANAARGLGEVATWAAMTDAKSVFLNYYGQGAVQALTPTKQTIIFNEETQYPLNGSIKITLAGLNTEEKFALAVRIPAWSTASAVKVNGENISDVKTGTYCSMERTWKNGDVIEISLDVSFHIWVNEKDATLGAVYYGPILLSAISPDGITLSMVQKISYNDFANATVRLSDDGNSWLTITVPASDGKTYTFYDFASAGKIKAYESWFKIGDMPAPISAEKFGTPIWCNK